MKRIIERFKALELVNFMIRIRATKVRFPLALSVVYPTMRFLEWGDTEIHEVRDSYCIKEIIQSPRMHIFSRIERQTARMLGHLLSNWLMT
jgi:hypothetical protein